MHAADTKKILEDEKKSVFLKLILAKAHPKWEHFDS